MTNKYFEANVHAKCILAGEHIVLRGGPALVLPLIQKNLTLTYDPSNHNNIILDQINDQTLSVLFWKTLEHALALLDKDIQDIHGKFLLKNSIRIGAGLGFSAALSVIVARFLVNMDWLQPHDIFKFAHGLEDLYHGKSSGADVAGVMAQHTVHYELNKKAREFKPVWFPSLYLSYSGFPKNTTLAIRQVTSINKNNPDLAAAIDHKMKESVQIIEKALIQNDSVTLLMTGLEKAKQCFQEWGLIPGALEDKITELYKLGALAVKPTGAGGGGYLLSLWPDQPPHEAGIHFTSVFTNQDIE